jgi:hypothetical protein
MRIYVAFFSDGCFSETTDWRGVEDALFDVRRSFVKHSQHPITGWDSGVDDRAVACYLQPSDVDKHMMLDKARVVISIDRIDVML